MQTPFLVTEDREAVRKWVEGLDPEAARDAAFALVMSLREARVMAETWEAITAATVRAVADHSLDNVLNIVAESIS